MIIKNFQQTRGFTMVEVLVAIAVIALGLVPIAEAFTRSMSLIEETSRKQRAIALLNSKVNEIKGTNTYMAIPGPNSMQNACSPQTVTIDNVPYTYTVQTMEINQSGAYDLKIMDVTVSYPSREESGTASVSSQSFIAPRVRDISGGGTFTGCIS